MYIFFFFHVIIEKERSLLLLKKKKKKKRKGAHFVLAVWQGSCWAWWVRKLKKDINQQKKKKKRKLQGTTFSHDFIILNFLLGVISYIYSQWHMIWYGIISVFFSLSEGIKYEGLNMFMNIEKFVFHF